MVEKSNKNSLIKRYRKALDIFEKNVKYLESVGADVNALHDCRQILDYMRSKNLVEVVHVLAAERKGTKSESSESLNEVGKMTLDEIRAKINSPRTTRAAMEKIASVRFGVSKGGISMLRSRDALREKIESLLVNEGAHDFISQVVRASENDALKDKK